MCHLFHKWSKWEQKAVIVTRAFADAKTAEFQQDVQTRRCEKCGYTQMEVLKV